MRRVLFGLLISDFCLLPAAAALQPNFHTETHLVQINVIVRDKNRPVANLKKENFLLTDRGKARPISVFSVTSSGETVAPALPPHTFSNLVGAPSSITVILLDRLNTLTGAGAASYEEHPQWAEELAIASARQHLIRFVETLQPKDRVAIYSLGKSLDVLSDFSSDRAQLLSILEKYKPVSLTRREDIDPLPVHIPTQPEFSIAIDQERQRYAAMVNGNRAQTTLAALSAIAGHVTAIPGRKNLVWLASDLSVPGTAAAHIVSRANMAIYPVDARGLLPEVDPSMNADDAGAMVFNRMAGKHVQGATPPSQETMADLAAETGGRAFLNTNDLEGAIRSAVDDAAVTYTLGFYVDEASLDGKFHEIKVRVKNENYEVRHPRGYFAFANEPAETNRFMKAIVAPLASSAIGVSVRVDRLATGALTVTGVIDLAGLELGPKPNLHTGVADVFMVQQDAAGTILDHSHQSYHLNLTDELYAKYLKSGIIFRDTIKPHDKLARLRVLVTGSGPRVGSVILPAAQLP